VLAVSIFTRSPALNRHQGRRDDLAFHPSAASPQLRALGLIQKSVKKRSLKDTATCWALTPYGEHYATVLKAIPSNTDS
jgi:hypothetical protein